MRVLITILHFHPMVPLAKALEEAGHEVAFVGESDYASVMEATGLRLFPAGTSMRELMPQLMPQLMAMPDEQREQWAMGNIFGRILPERMIPDLLAVCEEWKPDIIVRDMTEMAGCLVAEHLGLPHASVEIGIFIPTAWMAHWGMGENMDALRAGLGLPSDPDMDMAYRYLHLSFVPPSYQDPAAPLPPTTHALRTVPFDQSGNEKLPAWVHTLPQQPTVYVTMGLAFGGTAGTFPVVLEGLRDEPANLIVTVGRAVDPAQFGPQPANVHIERYIPQTLLFPYCDMVVSHGGWNTVMSALAEGLPLVNIPISADQPQNAERCAKLGVGRTVSLADLSPEAVRDAVREVMADPGYRERAQKTQKEMLSLPGPERAVELLERLVAEKKPILA